MPPSSGWRGRQLHHAGGEGNKKVGTSGYPDEQDAGTCGCGSGSPANAEHHHDVEQRQIAKLDTSFEGWRRGHVRRRIAEGRRTEELDFVEVLQLHLRSRST